ncbi:hypothetical protein K461DRAFT_168287 [Myriangium duriaei CBS 260.36]|uniref:Exonuclease V n=1 Tax=Myriangium duriaei CBS 260.36 TaxID=1168546 RepID=A0A9P4IWY1_9PEZI|nr:hypothetical protein K461DRAFT_168287 [Myriangium duriaei CBS 260.36]
MECGPRCLIWTLRSGKIRWKSSTTRAIASLSPRLVAREPSRDEQSSRRASPIPAQALAEDDTRSPLERFRTQRKRPMSVTDIVSPAWCELQYFYNLSKYGRVQQTPAMRQGSSVHKVLEEEVHVAVPVEVLTREDGFGLRIWNVIQGLRTLRTTGLTREFEVWGVVEGQVVNGVIDELSYTCPDPALEAALQSRKKPGRPKKQKEAELPVNQTTLSNFFSDKGASTLKDTLSASQNDALAPISAKKVYITDIKTRSSRSVPKDEVALRPTYMQLMIYRRLLSQLASDSVTADQIFARYHVDGEAIFSDVFISQIGGLDQPLQPPTSSYGSDADSDYAPNTQDSLTELLAHNNLSKLWTLMIAEIGAAIPDIGAMLRAEFRAAASGDVMGSKVFLNDERRLDGYVRDEMAWWKGDRAARGVDIEEAFKCRICSFADGCEWRKEKVEEGLRKAKTKEAGKKSEV